VTLVDGRAHEVLAACDLTLIASGTATLEAALFKCPMVVVYKMGGLNYRLMKGKAYLPWVSLPNILLRDFAVPELIQDAATPTEIAREALAWLEDAPRVAALRQQFNELHLMLRQDTARKASDAIATLLDA
jgi:lipid-A-disaccharide synthase